MHLPLSPHTPTCMHTPDPIQQKQENQKSTSLVNRHVKAFQQNTSRSNLTIHKIIDEQIKKRFNLCKSINTSYQMMNAKNHHHLNTFRESICWSSAFLQKKKKKLSAKYTRIVSQHSQDYIGQTHSLNHIQWGKVEIVLLRPGTRQIYSITLYWSLHIIYKDLLWHTVPHNYVKWLCQLILKICLIQMW